MPRDIDPETGNFFSVPDITVYGASVVRANLPPGTKYWKIVEATHLAGRVNRGNHNLFVDMIHADGTRAKLAHCTLFVGDKQFTNTIDKPDNEPGTNFPMFRGPRYDVEGADMSSDRAIGFTTELPDEEVGNTNGHHSFYVKFQEAVMEGGVTTGTIRGAVTNGAGRNLSLTGGAVNATTTAAADGSFGFDKIAAGAYTLAVVGTAVSQSVTVVAGQTANVTLIVPMPPPPPPPPTTGSISGTVTNGAGRSLSLSGNNVNLSTAASATGAFSFTAVPVGTYTLAVVGTSVSQAVTVQASQQTSVNLTVPDGSPSPDLAALQAQVNQLQAQVNTLQQQLNSVSADRNRLNSVLTQIKQAIQSAGL